jgi:hypothetical protein
MLATLRRLQPPRQRLQPVRVALPVQRALDLLRELLRELETEVRVEIDEQLTVVAEMDPLVQLFAPPPQRRAGGRTTRCDRRPQRRAP